MQLGIFETTFRRPSLGETLDGAEVYNDDVIRPLDNPLSSEGGLAVMTGNLAPAGAVIKHIAADPRLLKHTGPAVVFADYADMQKELMEVLEKHGWHGGMPPGMTPPQVEGATPPQVEPPTEGT